MKIFNYITHTDGITSDSLEEILEASKSFNSDSELIAILAGFGTKFDEVCKYVSKKYKKVWKFSDPIFTYPNAEIIRKLLIKVLPTKSFFLLSHCTFGMDLAPGLSVKLDSTYIPDVIDIKEFLNDKVKVVRQEFGGMVSVNYDCLVNNGLVMTLRPGSFQPDKNKDKVSGEIIEKSINGINLSSSRKFIEVKKAESGDVDITKSDILVSIGRGIEEEENIEIAEDLAESLGAVVSCSRPVVDSKWMEKSRQVGTSGQTVKPKVYIACGISGSFQHMGGLKGSPFIIAINKNIKAPIFQVSNVGVEADILEFIPELTDFIKNQS
jgi:electron transfer flavoprotein alpha subunit